MVSNLMANHAFWSGWGGSSDFNQDWPHFIRIESVAQQEKPSWFPVSRNLMPLNSMYKVILSNNGY